MNERKNEIKEINQFNFLFLPKDIQGVILKFLNTEQLGKLRQLSKHFKELAESILPQPSRSRFALSSNLIPMGAVITKEMFSIAADKVFTLGTQIFNNFRGAAARTKYVTTKGRFEQAIIEMKFPPGEVPKEKLSQPANPEAMVIHVYRNEWQMISYNEAPLSSKQKLNTIIEQINTITTEKGWKSYKDTTKINIGGKEYSVPTPIASIYNIARFEKESENDRLQKISIICQKLSESEPKSAFFAKKKDSQKVKASDIAADIKEIIDDKRFKP